MTSATTRSPQPAPHQIADEHREAADRALEILLDPALEPIVDMVLTHRDDRYEALAATGSVTFERTEAGEFVEVAHTGRNPLADQSTDKFVGLEAERQQASTRTATTTPTPSPTRRPPSSSTRPPPPTSA